MEEGGGQGAEPDSGSLSSGRDAEDLTATTLRSDRDEEKDQKMSESGEEDDEEEEKEDRDREGGKETSLGETANLTVSI